MTSQTKIKKFRCSQLSHQHKMQIYNECQSDRYYKVEIARKHNITIYTLNLVVQEIHDLIRYKIYGEAPKHPKVCNLCGGKVKHIRDDRHLSKGMFIYYCTNCGAWVSTNPKRPKDALGELANRDMRKRRRDLHQWFDKLWTTKKEREYYYDKLAVALGKSVCHFAQMSMEELDKAEEIVKKWWLEKYDR